MAGSAIDTALIFQAITLPSIRLKGKSPPRYSAGLTSGTNSLFDIAHTEASSVFSLDLLLSKRKLFGQFSDGYTE